jgi:lysozyme family protein
MTKINTTQSVICPTYITPLQRYKIKPSATKEVAEIVERINKNKAQYQRLEELTGVPWEFTSALHSLECDGRFDRHLANGDPVDQPTIYQPRGIAGGTWLNTAVAAYHLKNWVGRSDLDWDNKLLWLWRAEIWWNGDGYRHKSFEHRSPYLWAGTTEEMQGKYVSDGVWDANAISEQIGCVAIWDALGIKLMEGRSMEIKGNNLGLDKIIEDEKPIGRLIPTRNTWLKCYPEDSSTLFDLEKKRIIRDEVVVIYERLADIAHHYQIKHRAGDGISKVVSFVYQDHAGITIDGDDGDSRPISLMVSDVSNLGKAGGLIDPKDKKAIQGQLIRVGLLDGQKMSADGRWGSLSESAWRAWCRFAGINDFSVSPNAIALLQQQKGFKDLILAPKYPADKECQVATLCLQRMQDLGMWLAVSIGSDSPSWNFFYLSGTNADGTFNKDSIDNMNDLRFLAQIGSDGRVSVGGCWIATWDAGWKYRKDRMNDNGCWQQDYDRQFWSWRVGMHGHAAPHEALVQQDPEVGGDVITGTRDDNENGRDVSDRKYSDGGAVNHHGTPGRSPGDPIGPWCAGCGVGDNFNSHKNDFMPKIKSDRRIKASAGFLVNACFLDRSKIKGLPLKG